MGNPSLVFDLEKAKKNLSKLVPKQVQVTRNGRTFTQTVYVDPTTGQQPTQATNSPIDYQEFMRMAYAQNDKAAAIAYLEKQGVTWKKSPIEGVNWMRAAMAAKSAAGITSTAPAAPTGGKPTAATPAPSTAAGNAQSAQSGKASKIDYQKLAAAGYDKADGKTKVALLKQTISRDEFMVLARVLTHWDASPHEGVNLMRASMAMSKWCAANDLDYLSQMTSGQHLDTATADIAANAAAPATKAKKDKADTQAPPAPVKPKDELEVDPAKHTQRQQNIIKFINGISDPKLLKGLAATGIVPEDTDAQTFVLDRLGKEYDTHIRPSLNGTGGYSSSRYTSQTDLKKQFAKRTTKVFKGVHQKIVSRAAHSIVRPEMLYDFVDPRSGATVYSNCRGGYGQRTDFGKMVVDLNNKFGGYSGDEAPDGHSSERYAYDKERALWANTLIAKGVLDQETLSSMFDLEKEGIVRALRAVGESDPKLKAKADEMVQTYSDLMKAVQYNPTTLDEILRLPFDTLQNMGKTEQEQLKRINAVIEHLKTQYNLSEDDINMTIKRGEYETVNRFKLYRANGDAARDDADGVIFADLSTLADPETGEILFPNPTDYVIHGWGNGIPWRIAQAAIDLDGHLPVDFDHSIITPEMYDRVIELSSKLMGVKYQDHNTQAPLDPSIKFHEFDSNMWADVETLKDGDDLEKDAVLTNLSFILNVAEVNGDIAWHVTDCPDSAANKQGTDYSGNFNYVGPTAMKKKTDGSQAPTMTPDEKSKILLEQLKKTPMFSLAELQQLSAYVQSNGDPNQSLGYGMAANETLSRIKSLSPQHQGWDGIKGTPIDEIFQRYTEAALQYCPQVYTVRVQDDKKMKEWARKTVGFVPYVDPNAAAQATMDPAVGTQLYQLRSALFKAAHCTLRTADATEYADITHRVKIDFDYTDPVTGKRVDKAKRKYDDRSLALHGKVYVISNSEQEEKFRAEAARMGEQPVQMYHGTSYGGAAGIVGVDGQFRISGVNTQGLQVSGSMLGQGIYMAKLVGKTLPYMGNSKYSFQYHTLDKQPGPTAGFAADGALLVCDALMGKHYHSDTSVWDAQAHNDGTYDSVSVGAGAAMGGTTLREYECIVRRNNQVMPKFIVDCGGRSRR